ncbi:MAG: hypothetical protein WC802_04535 [Patescibacteria group bacterium]|jgi:hypothetical protein
MQTWLKDLLRGALLVAFFVSTLFLSSFSERVFLSPDESANFYFAQTFGNTGELSAPVMPDSGTRGNLNTEVLHPRSIVAVGERLLPGSFLGLPLLAGAVYRFAGDTGALLVTPFLALLAVLAFRSVINKLFEDEALADLSALFLMIHPSFLYFSGRVMLHNVAFLAFVIFGLYFAVARPLGLKSVLAKDFRRIEFFLAGTMIGTALLIRTAEAPWVIPVFAILLIVYRNELGWRNIFYSLLGFGALCVVILGMNSWVYGSMLTTGYTVHVSAPVATVISSTASDSTLSHPLSPFLTFSLPFGLHPRAILRNFWSYGIVLYPWMTIPSLLGALLLIVRKFEKKKAWKVLFAITVFVSAWLVAFYGSANIHDNPDLKIISIGNSYVRYWLPMFALSMPFAGYLFISAWRYISIRYEMYKMYKMAWRAMLAVLVLAGCVNSTDLVLNGHDGLIESRSALNSFISKRYQILSHTELNSIIVVDRADKYLFPKRAVVTPLRDDQTYSALPALVAHAPTYYFGITFPQTDLDFLNNERFKADELRFELVQTMDEESLYRITKSK